MNDPQIRAAREKVLDAIRELDTLYSDKGLYDEPRSGNEIPTHVLVIASWHRMEDDGDDTVGLTHFALTDNLADWQIIGLCRAQAMYAEARLQGD